MSKPAPCACLLCHPVPGKRSHPKWGYDLDMVASRLCFTCKEPIGDEAYVEDTALARFGDMFFRHKRCDPEKPKKRA
jgi:hypothetical protein